MPLSRRDLISHLQKFMKGKLTKTLVRSEPDWIEGFVRVIEGLIDGDEMLKGDASGLLFESLEKPPIELLDYVWLLHIGMSAYGCGSGMWVTALLLLKRFLATNHTKLTTYTVHRLILVSSVIAAKVVDDEQPSNRVSAAIGGVDMGNLNSMEAEFLLAIDFKTFPSEEEYGIQLQEISCPPLSPTLSSCGLSDSCRTAPVLSPLSMTVLSDGVPEIPPTLQLPESQIDITSNEVKKQKPSPRRPANVLKAAFKKIRHIF